MSSLLDILGTRGLLQDATPDLGGRLAQGPITGYCGFDPTSDSLHVGNLVPVMGLAWLQRTGGRPLVVVGGGTALVGDPSGKRSERPVLDPDQVAANAEALQGQLSRFLDFEGPDGALMFNNADWLSGVGLLDFLRDTGKHFTVNYMLQKESVRNRMDDGISFTEFAYTLVQAYDFEHLYRTAGCELQLGGSDQWGNITAGIELVARRHQAQVHGLTLPLLTTATGAKFGKSEDGNVWLDPAKTSPYRFYQYWINQDDRDVERLLRCFTFLPDREITELAAAHAANPQAREAQRRLAADVTARVHGDEVLTGVEAASRILFGGGEIGGADAATLAVVAAEVPTALLGRDQLGAFTAVEGLVATGLASSKADARRGIQGGGYSLNGIRLEADRALESADVLGGRYLVLQRGRRNYALLILD